MKLRLVSILFFAFILNAWSQNIPEKPNPARFVNDFANLLSEQEEYSLEQKLRNYQDTTSNQFTIVTIESLEGYDIESYSYSLASKWGIGQKGKNNGILITVSKMEHKVRIEVGYGLEGVIPDLVAKRVIREVITPSFKQGSFYAGLDEGTTHLIKYASGEFKADPKDKKGKSGGKAIIFIVIIIIFIIISFISKVNKVRGSNIGNNSLSLWTILALLGSGGNDRHRGGGGGWGGGSSGGGGGFDFGGGGFGGGGSSGDW